jgi:hypothetical protein
MRDRSWLSWLEGLEEGVALSSLSLPCSPLAMVAVSGPSETKLHDLDFEYSLYYHVFGSCTCGRCSTRGYM